MRAAILPIDSDTKRHMARSRGDLPQPALPFVADRWPVAARYALASGLVALFLALRIALDSLLAEDVPFLTLFPAVMLAAYTAGLWPGVWASCLSVAAGWYFLIQPRHSFTLVTRQEAVALTLFAIVLVLECLLVWVMRSALQRLRGIQRQLEQSEEKFRALADHIPQLAWMGDGNGNLYWYNQRWLDYTGVPMEEMVGWGWQAVHHPDHVERVVRKFVQHVGSGEPWEDTFPLRARDGSWRWFLSRALPLRNAAGEVTRWFGTNTDITEQMMAENALRESQQQLVAREAALRRTDRQKDIFLATLAHELRNPLAPIRAASHIVSARAQHPQALRAAATIERQVRHMARLVDDLLDLSRIHADKLSLQLAHVDLREVVRRAVETCQPQLVEKRQDLQTRLPSQSVIAYADVHRAVQCVVNLLHNASKFTPEEGHIELELSIDARGRASLRVCDDGQGIPAEMLPRVFELFEQERQSGEDGNSGLGIGLALARHIAQLHGAEIVARSQGPGKGSEFEVLWPLA